MGIRLMIKEEDKEFYRLRYEYLKASDAYRDYCEWKKEESHPFSPPEKLKNYENFESIEYLVYLYWGNIYNYSFDEWWEKKQNSITFPAIEDFLRIFDETLNFCFRFYKAHEEREPTALEFRNYFFSCPWVMRPEYLYLKIDVMNKTTEELKKEFGVFVKNRKKNPDVKKILKDEAQPILPSSNYSKSNLKEIARYLKVFKLKKKFKKWATVIEKIDPEGEIHTGDEAEILRSWKRELQKANIIIKNVECGEFPGNYL